jgi:hypothetical protein
MVFFDLEKAFDTVRHGGLINKLYIREYPRYFQCLIHSFLTERSFQVFLNDTSCDPVGILAGVSQRSVLSPNLYNIFIHDAPTNDGTESAIYADDSDIFSSSIDPTHVIRCLQEHSNALLKYFSSWKIKINSSMTVKIYLPGCQMDVNGLNIRWAPKVKYMDLIREIHIQGPL